MPKRATYRTHSNSPSTEPESAPARPSAVMACTRAYFDALAAAGGSDVPGAKGAAEAAFRGAMPPMSDQNSVRDFIACVAQGMAFGVFWGEDSARIIAAAKLALSAFPAERRKRGRPRSAQCSEK